MSARLFLTFSVLILLWGCGGPEPPAGTPSPTPELSEFEKHKQKGIELTNLTAWEAAVPELEAASELNAEDPEVQYYLFVSHQKQEDEPSKGSGAYRAAEKLAALDPQGERGKEALVYLEGARALARSDEAFGLLEEGKYKQAKELLLPAKQADPESARIRFGLFRACANTEKVSKTSASYQNATEALKLGLDGPEAGYTREWIKGVDAGLASPRGAVEGLFEALRNFDDPTGLIPFFPSQYLTQARRNVAGLNERQHRQLLQTVAALFRHLRVEVLGENVQGNQAKVSVRTSYTDPKTGKTTSQSESFPLVLEDGLWKLDVQKFRK